MKNVYFMLLGISTVINIYPMEAPPKARANQTTRIKEITRARFDISRSTDRDNPKKAFIRALILGDLEAVKKERLTVVTLSQTYEGKIGFAEYSTNTHLTPLQWAICAMSKQRPQNPNHEDHWKKPFLALIELLLDNNANPNVTVNSTKNELHHYRISFHPLALAYLFELPEVFQLLLDKGALIAPDHLWMMDAKRYQKDHYYFDLLKYYRQYQQQQKDDELARSAKRKRVTYDQDPKNS